MQSTDAIGAYWTEHASFNPSASARHVSRYHEPVHDTPDAAEAVVRNPRARQTTAGGYVRWSTFPRKAVGTVVGLGGMAGAIGGMTIAWITGRILEATGSYVPVFLMAAFAYLTALAVIHMLVPRLDPAHLG